MSAVEQNLSYDDILDAVKESKRGRWFLDEYEGRLRKSDSAGLLSAISKLESVMAGLAGSGADAALLARAKSAILAACKDIAALGASPAGLSESWTLSGRKFSSKNRRGSDAAAARWQAASQSGRPPPYRGLRAGPELSSSNMRQDRRKAARATAWSSSRQPGMLAKSVGKKTGGVVFSMDRAPARVAPRSRSVMTPAGFKPALR